MVNVPHSTLHERIIPITCFCNLCNGSINTSVTCKNIYKTITYYKHNYLLTHAYMKDKVITFYCFEYNISRYLGHKIMLYACFVNYTEK